MMPRLSSFVPIFISSKDVSRVFDELRNKSNKAGGTIVDFQILAKPHFMCIDLIFAKIVVEG